MDERSKLLSLAQRTLVLNSCCEVTTDVIARNAPIVSTTKTLNYTFIRPFLLTGTMS